MKNAKPEQQLLPQMATARMENDDERRQYLGAQLIWETADSSRAKGRRVAIGDEVTVVHKPL